MGHDADLKTLVDGLKRSVIDLYMLRQGWKVRDDDYYVEVLDWANRYLPVLHDTPKLCTRPDAKGLRRGGEIYDHTEDLPQGNTGARQYPSDRYIIKFGRIWGQIDDIVDRWYDLPDPALIGEATTAYAKIVSNLCLGTNENLTGDGSLVPNMTRIWDGLVGHTDEGGYEPALSGKAIDDFKDYIRYLDQALGGCGAIARSLEKYVDAQQQLWSVARESVHTIVTSIASTCDSIVKKTRLETGFSVEDLTLGETVASAAPGPVGLAVSGVVLLVTTIEETTNNPVPLRVEIESAEGALDLLDKLLNVGCEGFGVSQMIETFERKTRAAVATSISEVDDQRTLFDLVPGTIERVDDVIRYDKAEADKIYRRIDSVGVELGNIAGQLSGCAGALRPLPGPLIQGNSILERDYRIGGSRSGPSDDIVALTDLLRQLLGELSGEVEAGAGNFKAAMDALDQRNSETEAALRAAAAAFELSDAGGVDSFNYAPWTPEGLAEREFSILRYTGSSSNAGRSTVPTGPPDASDTGSDATPWRPQVPQLADRWRVMQGLEPVGSDPTSSQPWCPADPADD